MGKFMALYENDMLKVEILKTRLQELRELEQRLQVRKAEIERKLHTGDAAPIPFGVLKGILREFRNVFKWADHGKQKQLVHTMVKKIIVSKDRKIKEVQWGVPITTKFNPLIAKSVGPFPHFKIFLISSPNIY
ncbi:hypothetical protein [Brevibacillus migulae]|uniref:hypothetical protein n=1 Tax=Brevibacillus migulae TaxID=1644114 RepID=UPI00106E059D|nr:hypothetical protein [Brevibacillus migulae]